MIKLLQNPFRSMLPKSIQRQSQVDETGEVLHVEVWPNEVEQRFAIIPQSRYALQCKNLGATRLAWKSELKSLYRELNG